MTRKTENENKEVRANTPSIGKISNLEKNKSLEHSVILTITVGAFIASIFFLSSSLTGNVIGDLNQTSSSWIGGVLFIIGAGGAFTYLKRR